MTYTIAITSRLIANHPPAMQFLKDRGYRLVERLADSLPEDEFAELLADADGLITGTPLVTERVLAGAPRLRVICRGGVGYDAVDVEACTRRGIVVAITPGVNHETVADSALTFILALARKLVFNHEMTRSGSWRSRFQEQVGIEVFGKTLGIVGFGRIGQCVARRARGFGMEVLAYDVVPRPETAAQLGVTFVSLDDLVRRADFVTLHTPLTPETRHLVDERVLGLMKPSAYLVNTARGGLVDEAALARALRERRIAGAGLDVLSAEPPPADHPLLGLENVLLMPHMAGLSWESLARTGEMAAQAVVDVLEGRLPVGAVNPEALERR